MQATRVLSLLLLAARDAVADVYMQYPPGSNNRLAEGGGNRNNNNRLMDTQNNAKGGYGYGGNSNTDNTGMGSAEIVKYYAGSVLPVAWTAQHSCGREEAECQIVIQYMCNDRVNRPGPGGPYSQNDVANSPNSANEGPVRDGANGNTPNPNAPDSDTGLHEPASFYNACANRERNKGLYTADQNLNSNRATRTRQNPNGARSGLECAEERDYYPYWAPTPWKDLAILTNNLALCSWYRTESQNVRGRGFCKTANAAAEKPWSKATCEAQAGSVWVEVPPFNIPPPECYAAPETRDNHLGNDRSGNEVTAHIKVPFGANGVDPITGARIDDAERCVLRLRYNITTVDTRACSVGATPGTKSPHTTKDACELAGGIWSAAFLTSAYDDSNLASTPPLPNQDPKVGVGRCSGSTGCPATQNVLRSSDAPGADDTDSILELAVNTNQFGRTFQDRSHVFSIQSRPPAIPENQIIHNLNVAGKRGNIVQTYPATEYRYNPEDLTVGRSDLIHFQWTGNDNTNNNGNNNGEGTNNEDRHNLVQFSNLGLSVPGKTEDFALQGILDMFDVEKEINPDAAGTAFGGARPLDELKKQFALAKQSGCASSANVNNDQQNDNCQKLNRELPTVDLGLLQMKPGTYRYLSTRNNNFSNRAQKGKITVLETPHQQPPPPLNVSVWAEPGPTAENGRVVVTWQAPGHVNLDGTYRAYVGTDGLQYWGLEREAKMATSYRVQYSEDGGLTWSPTNCMTSCTPGVDCACTIEGLRAGTPIAVQVRSVSQGGLSVPSATMVTKTLDSATSRSYYAQLGLEAEGKYITTGSTAAIVLGSLSGIFGFGLLIWFVLFGGYEHFMHRVRRMKPPPPPPPARGKF